VADGREAPTKLTAVSYLSERSFESSTTDASFFPFSVSGSPQAIDTGTSLIYVPPTIASAFYSLIPGSKRASQYGSGKRTLPPAMC